MFIRMLNVLCDQNECSEIAINGYQVRKKKKKRHLWFPLWKTFLRVKSEVGMFTKLST